MEKMPYQSHLEPTLPLAPLQTPTTVATDWRTRAAALTGEPGEPARTARERRAGPVRRAVERAGVQVHLAAAGDGGRLRALHQLGDPAAAGGPVCVLRGRAARSRTRPIGIFQVRSLEPAFGTAEWGFALASEFWGTGIFVDGAKLVVDFAFEVLGVHRLEARAALKNGRGNGALRKLGAVQEGVLRRSFLRNGEYLDQALWTILQDEWMQAKTVWGSRVIH